jgi:hypothetical protein
MQDKYVADVGDFGKYGLLSALCDGRPQLRLGVVWCFVRDRMLEYLEKPQDFRPCNLALFDKLKAIVDKCQRTIRAVQKGDILPSGTEFFCDPLPGSRGRRQWLEKAREKMKGCDVVFFDPDNGLSARPTGAPGPRHIGIGEIREFLDGGDGRQSLIVYHQLGRQGIHPDQITRRASELAKGLRRPRGVFALHYNRGTARAFFVLPADEHAQTLRQRAGAMVKGPWGAHFKLCPP